MSVVAPIPSEGRPRRRGRTAAVATSLVAHGAILFVLFPPKTDKPEPPEPPPILVSMVEAPPVFAPPTAPAPTPDKPPPPKTLVRPTPRPPPREVPKLVADKPAPSQPAEGVNESELAGAATAGSGPPGRACNMPQWLQAALRKDQMVHAAVAQTPAAIGKALKVWDGDWVQTSGQEGKGLAAVREAIMWEVAFAPVACRTEPVHGLVLLSLSDGPGAPRLVMGTGYWRWSDLLHARGELARASLD